MVIFRFSTLASIIDVSKEIVQFKYQCYLKCLEHDENSLNYDKQYEYFYHIWISSLKRHKNFTDILTKFKKTPVPSFIKSKGKFY